MVNAVSSQARALLVADHTNKIYTRPRREVGSGHALKSGVSKVANAGDRAMTIRCFLVAFAALFASHCLAAVDTVIPLPKERRFGWF